MRVGWLRTGRYAVVVVLLLGALSIVRSFSTSQHVQQQPVLIPRVLPTSAAMPSPVEPQSTLRIASPIPAPSATFPDFSNIYDKNITELIVDAPEVDGTLYNVTSAASGVDGGRFLSSVNWQGKCFYLVKNFCVVRGQLTMFHDPADQSSRTVKLRMCNEFSQHSPTIRLSYRSEPMPSLLPAPLNTITRGWVLQFWCQDLFHMTLSLMPAFHTKRFLGDHPDVFIRIAKGVRRKGGYCRVKLGDPRNWKDVKNKKWGGDKQFPFAGNPYWPFYRVITPDPHRIYPLYPGSTAKSMCYTRGVLDKVYLKDLVGDQARNYSGALLDALEVVRGPPRQCRKYRLTMIDRRGKTRTLTNVPQLVDIATRKGFIAQSVALETLPIREQLRLITSTDVLMGMHGNGMTWLQFLPPGSAVVELIGVWYTPYALLWGHKHFHSSMKNNMAFKKGGEFVPFQHNETEVGELLDQVLEYLDGTSCNEAFDPPNEKLENLYRSCVPHC